MSSLTIAHATAMTAEDRPIFEHAVALARAAGARLLSIHADDATEPAAAPDADGVLAGWGRGSERVDHEALVHRCCDDPIDTLVDALQRATPHLVITGTHQRHGAARLFTSSHAEAIVENVEGPTLVFPIGARGFVGPTGEIELRRFVVLAGDPEAAAAALDRAAWFADLAGLGPLEIVLLTAGSAEPPDVVAPAHEGITLSTARVEDDDLARAVVELAEPPCIVVMATRGEDSIGDMVFGTHTERVLREARCPVLVVPIP